MISSNDVAHDINRALWTNLRSRGWIIRPVPGRADYFDIRREGSAEVFRVQVTKLIQVSVETAQRMFEC